MPSNNNNNNSNNNNSNNLVVTHNNSILDICSTPGSRRCLVDTTNTTTGQELGPLGSTHQGMGLMDRGDQEDQVDPLAILLVLLASLATR